jgi:hypothetical protein
MEAKKIQYENAKKSEYTGKSIILDQPQITLHIDNLVIYKEDKERFKIIDIEDDYITIQNKSKTVKFNAVESFNKYFEIIPSLITLNKLFWDEQSQDVTLQIDTPVIAKINNKDVGIVNNERFKITKIEKNIITIQNTNKSITFDAAENNAFQRFFRVAYATTCHSSQGMSIREQYLIHEWNRYTNKMRYVALSRSTTYEHINIYC